MCVSISPMQYWTKITGSAGSQLVSAGNKDKILVKKKKKRIFLWSSVMIINFRHHWLRKYLMTKGHYKFSKTFKWISIEWITTASKCFGKYIDRSETLFHQACLWILSKYLSNECVNKKRMEICRQCLCLYGLVALFIVIPVPNPCLPWVRELRAQKPPSVQ